MAFDPKPDLTLTLVAIRHERDALLLSGEESIELTEDAVEKHRRVSFEKMLSCPTNSSGEDGAKDNRYRLSTDRARCCAVFPHHF
jgi:hypothetical protein